MTYFSVYILQFVLLGLVHLFSLTEFAKKFLFKKAFFLVSLLVIVSVQIGTSALLMHQVGDVLLFEGAGYHYRYNSDFYFIDQEHTQYPFFPFLIFLHAFLNWIVVTLGVFTFSFYLKLTMLPLLIGMTVMIIKTQKSRLAGIQFLTHPIVTLVVFFHGQVDVFLLFFLLCSAVLFKYKHSVESWFFAVFLFACSIASKTWSILLLPYLFLIQKNMVRRMSLPILISFWLALCIFIYTRTVFGSGFSVVLPAVLAPGGPIGIWGVTVILPFLSQVSSTVLTAVYLGLLGVVTLIIWYIKTPLWKALFLLVLAAVLLNPRFGIQYLLWFLPFMYMAGVWSTWQFRAFSILGGAFAFATYINVLFSMVVVPKILLLALGFLTWTLLVYWWCTVFAIQYMQRQSSSVGRAAVS